MEGSEWLMCNVNNCDLFHFQCIPVYDEQDPGVEGVAEQVSVTPGSVDPSV